MNTTLTKILPVVGLIAYSLPCAGQVEYPPKLPDGKRLVDDRSDEFLKPPSGLREGVLIARTAPRIEMFYYPGQTYAGKPWSNWGDSLAINGKYYASIGDHLAPQGNAFVYEYDPQKRTLRLLTDLASVLDLPEGHYVPGKIHGRLDLGNDGWIYFATHRGSTRVTRDQFHYQGDWILRVHPESGECQIVCHAPVEKHCIPNSLLDPKRMIFYGGTAAGTDAPHQEIRFFAYDVRARKLLYEGPGGPARSMMLSRSSGQIYYTPELALSPLMRFDPSRPQPVPIDGEIGVRAATQETASGWIYSVSRGGRGQDAILYGLNTKTEEVRRLGPIGVGSQSYIATLDADPTGRFLYYVPGAHGGSHQDGSPLVQYDTQTGKQKVLAFMHPFYESRYGCSLKGTYSVAVDPAGDKVYITWNASRGSRHWDCCALTVVHVPESER